MNPLNPLFAVTVMLIAFITGYLINLKFKINNVIGRYETIDGLRGFLAIGVFIHHVSIWFQYIKINMWDLPKSNLYVHFGQTSVALFFMITSFLFVSKLINSKDNKFNWRDFFISRFFRLAPLYFFSLLIIILSVIHLSYWKFNTTTFSFIRNILDWCSFTITGAPDINNSNLTGLINAGVTWSLPYEWLFYFSLPVISLFITTQKPKRRFLFLSIIFFVFFYYKHQIISYHIYAFLGGAVAPFLLKYISINNKIKDTAASIIIVLCLYLIIQYDRALNLYCIILISIIFTLVALGASLFGLLKTSTMKFLGDICYSTYLLHGIILFITFYFIIWFHNLRTYTPEQYCYVIFIITPILIMLSYISFRFIEKPGMNLSKKIIEKLEAKNQ